MKPEEALFCLDHMLHEDINNSCINCPLYEGHEIDIDCPHYKTAIQLSKRALLAWKADVDVTGGC